MGPTPLLPACPAAVTGFRLHMMERLTAYDRPFFGRADNMVLGPLNPAETGRALSLNAADAIDAHLITGGLPGIIRTWPHTTPPLAFLDAECADPAAPVSASPNPRSWPSSPPRTKQGASSRLSAAATAPTPTSPPPREAAKAPSPRAPFPPAPPPHRGKRVLAVDHPLSTQPGKPALHRVADSNLRLYSPSAEPLRNKPAVVARTRPSNCYAAAGPPGAAARSNPSSAKPSSSPPSPAHSRGPTPQPSADGGTARSTLRSTSSEPTAHPSLANSSSPAPSNGSAHRSTTTTSASSFAPPH